MRFLHSSYASNLIPSLSMRRLYTTSVNPEEIAKFSSHSSEWWNLKGEFYFLHQMNPTRLQFIRNLVAQQLPISSQPAWPLYRKKVLDIGCGGGLLSESLARMGAHVLGVDASEQNIEIAKQHALHQAFKLGSLTYQCTTAEDLQKKGEKFDVICALELLEHVNEPKQLLDVFFDMLEPHGLLFVSTLNRTQLSQFLSITLAEHWLGWISKGTHDYSKYITPQELKDYSFSKAYMVDLKGMMLNPLTSSWSLCTLPDPLLVNYIACLRLHPSHLSSSSSSSSSSSFSSLKVGE